jgi:hypothetical protein
LAGVSYLSKKSWGGVVYGQNTMAKNCSYAQRECLDIALSRGILAIYHILPRYLIGYQRN